MEPLPTSRRIFRGSWDSRSSAALPLTSSSLTSEHPIGYPSATDPEGRLPETFEVKTMPTSFLIDRDGVVRYIHRGFRESDIKEIRKQIRKFVEAK